MSTVDIDTTEYFKAFTTPREYFSDDESYSNYLNAYADRVDQYARTLKAELLAKMPEPVDKHTKTYLKYHAKGYNTALAEITKLVESL